MLAPALAVQLLKTIRFFKSKKQNVKDSSKILRKTGKNFA